MHAPVSEPTTLSAVAGSWPAFGAVCFGYAAPSRQSAPTVTVTPETSVDFFTELAGIPRDLATSWASPARSALG